LSGRKTWAPYVSETRLTTNRLTGEGSRDFSSQNGSVSRLGSYTRVSTSSQGAQMQLDALVTAGVQKCDVFADLTSGQSGAGSLSYSRPLLGGPKACPSN
jgi:large exoprotein involved in heme utilization and adhesion